MITLEQLQAGIVLPIDKPRQWTSFQAVNKVKTVVRQCYGLKKFKIGHAGTLDPLASGLLLVCLGKATKRIPVLQDGDKEYTGTMVFGATTPCYDLEQAVDRYYPYGHIDCQLVTETAHRFTGILQQTPPLFSAVKVDGQRAYALARATEKATVKSRPVNVYSFEITAFRAGFEHYKEDFRSAVQAHSTGFRESHAPHLYQYPQGEVPPHLPQADFRIHCGKGTYIRSLARDLGEALGSGAFISALRRERVGNYTVNRALALDEVEAWFASSEIT
mgnify:CR=1 FL=1